MCPASPKGNSNRKRAQRGVVLLDVVAALAIVGLAAFVLMPRPRSSIGAAELSAEAVRVSGEFRKGRAKALTTGTPFVVPKVAICDPAVTLGLPPALTAATGMDAIARCIETFLSPAFNLPADGIALDGLRRAWRHIERATRQPGDRDARLNMMSASMQGALAFQKGLGCVHSLSHSLGGIDPRLHHGTLNAIFLPAVIAFNEAAASVREEDKLDRMAKAVDLASGAEGRPCVP
jgi:alcohol dehydrogenase class IV